MVVSVDEFIYLKRRINANNLQNWTLYRVYDINKQYQLSK